MHGQKTVVETIREAPLRDKLQLGFMATSAVGLLLGVGSVAAWAIWSRVGAPVMLFDPRLDLCQAIGQWGGLLVIVGLVGMGMVSGDASVRSRLQRYGGVLFWASVLAILALSKTAAFARMSVAEVFSTLPGKVLLAGLLAGAAAMICSMLLDIRAWITKPKAV